MVDIEQNGDAHFLIDADKILHDLTGGDRIQRGDRFIGQDDLRVLGEGAGQCHTLLLAAGELVGADVGLIQDADLIEGLQGLHFILPAENTQQYPPEWHIRYAGGENIFDDGGAGDQIERLEHHADAPAETAQAFAGKEHDMNRIITIGREFGSGGRELGYRIAEKLQIAYYDQEIITEIAKRTALSEEYVRRIEEKRPVMHFPIHTGHSIYLTSEPTFYPDLSIYTKQHELLRELSLKSDCVIVGRCADYILREQKPVRIFAYADMESRIKRCMERRPEDEHLTEAQMKKRIAEIDRSRAKYYAFFSEQKWGARENYDLLVNTSGADIKKLSSALCAYLEAMFE